MRAPRAPAADAHASGERHHRVAVIGAGFSGIGLAIGLLRRGVRDFVVFERATDVGGTWRDNTYPGAACDVPSNLYSFSFAPNPSWSRSFSPQSEIQAYLRSCAARFGVLPHVRLGCEVRHAAWDEASNRWLLATSEGAHSSDVLVSARGPLSEPRRPDICGLETFAGPVVHSARWDHGHDFAGERVAVIGAGASAAQFVPEIQPRVGRLHVFVRTPPWVIPRRDRRFSRFERGAFRRFPLLQLAARGALYWGRELYVAGFVGEREGRRARGHAAVLAARRLLERQVADPQLREKLTPRYELGCKRILLSNDFYRSLVRRNVEVVTEPITRVTPDSVVTADGAERRVDVIVLGTGFDVTGHAAASCTVGRGNRTLADAWRPRVAAYKGMTVAGFPNLFLMVGPNSGLGHSSIVFVIESQIAYVLDALDTMARRELASVEVTAESQASWSDRIDELSGSTVWTAGGCRSYYLDDEGRNIALWPRTSWSYRRATRRFDLDAYRTVPARTAPEQRGAEASPVLTVRSAAPRPHLEDSRVPASS